MENKRVEWIDIAKFIGIFTIYLGHFGNDAGLAARFVFYFHVALFFFISGCMDTYDKEKNILKYWWKKCKRILFPFYGFSILSIIINAIMTNMSMGDIRTNLIIVLRGVIRNVIVNALQQWYSCCKAYFLFGSFLLPANHIFMMLCDFTAYLFIF